MELDNIELNLEIVDLLSYGQIQSPLKLGGHSAVGSKKVLIKRHRSNLEAQGSKPASNRPGLSLRAMKSDVE